MSHGEVDRAFVDDAHRKGIEVAVWAHQRPCRRRCISSIWGVDSLITDTPTTVHDVSAELAKLTPSQRALIQANQLFGFDQVTESGNNRTDLSLPVWLENLSNCVCLCFSFGRIQPQSMCNCERNQCGHNYRTVFVGDKPTIKMPITASANGMGTTAAGIATIKQPIANAGGICGKRTLTAAPMCHR